VPAPPECEENTDCPNGEVCFEGTCVPIAGTCAATDDHCAVNEALCNEGGTGDCFCLPRFGGGVACMQVFVPGSECGDCTSDAECAALAPDAVAVCVSPSENGCPCDPGQGICALICPNQPAT
jgi:Cys-rich repeat protein